MNSPMVPLIGLSGRQYDYEVCRYELPWRKVGGNYVLGYINFRGWWTSLYIGETDNFDERMSSHPKWLLATVLGGQLVLARYNPILSARKAEEEDLIRRYRPILNVQHQPLLGRMPAPFGLAPPRRRGILLGDL